MENRKGMTPLGPEGYKKGLEHWPYRLARGWERQGKGGGKDEDGDGGKGREGRGRKGYET